MRKKSILVKALPFVMGIVLLKYAVQVLGREFIELNALFTSFVAANVFLLGFLMAGVLADFKESEKLPGELAVSLESISDESEMLYKGKNLNAAKECQEHMRVLVACLKDWFHKKERTRTIFKSLSDLNSFLVAFEPHTQANYIVRLKQEQANIRRIVTRIDTIRDTSFVSSGYRIAEVNSILLILGLVALDLGSFTNEVFLTGSISLLFIYMMFLIKDLDDPFGFHSADSFENVSIRAIEDLEERLFTNAHSRGVNGDFRLDVQK
jgi:predicted membrane chloride channel (bestrophin family)